MIVAKINCSKIDKSKLFKGKDGTYLDIVLIETPNGKFDNDYMVVQGVSKEDRAKGVKGAILGNGKIIQKQGVPQQRQQQRPQTQAAPEDPDVTF